MRRLALPFLAALALASAASAGPQVTATAPVKNFRLPAFTDEGFRRLTVVAAEARLPDPARIDLTEMMLTLFTGRADEQIDAMLAAPVATFLPEKQFASGAQTVRLERADISVTGSDWSYDHAARKIVIRRDARVTFHAALGDILK